MKIEIVTTKKKLTKSILNQMPLAGLPQIQSGKVLGYILNSIKDIKKAYLIINYGKYYILPANYRKSTNCVIRKIGKRTITKEFHDEDEFQIWWDQFNLRRRELDSNTQGTFSLNGFTFKIQLDI